MLSGAVRWAVKGRLPWVRARDWRARREVKLVVIWSGVGRGERGGKMVGVDIVKIVLYPGRWRKARLSKPNTKSSFQICHVFTS